MTSPMDRFRQAAPAAGSAPAAPQGPRRSRYAGVKAADDRYPMPYEGVYRFRIIESIETENAKTGLHFKATLQIVQIFDGGKDMRGEVVIASHAPGDHVTMLQGVNPGAQFQVGGPQVKRFCLAAVGLEVEPPVEPDGSDPFADAIEAAAGRYNNTFPVNPIIGRLVDAQVTRGKDDGKGSWYRQYAFLPVSEAEQAGAAAAQ